VNIARSQHIDRAATMTIASCLIYQQPDAEPESGAKCCLISTLTPGRDVWSRSDGYGVRNLLAQLSDVAVVIRVQPAR
jgi:hypothetical protein